MSSLESEHEGLKMGRRSLLRVKGMEMGAGGRKREVGLKPVGNSWRGCFFFDGYTCMSLRTSCKC